MYININILLYNVHKIELSKLPTRPHDTVLVRFSWALSYVIHVIFMMYYTVMFLLGVWDGRSSGQL